MATKNADWRATQARIGSVISAKAFATAVTIFAVLAADAGAFEIVGHRGARGLRPENTLAAFQAGVAAGATTVEADVTLTRDRQVVVHHDQRVSGTVCSGPYQNRFFKNLTLAQVRRLDCGKRNVADRLAATQVPVPGSHIPTLGQVYRAVGVRVMVEPKTDPYARRESFPAREVARRVVATIRHARGVRRTTIQSFDWRVLREVGRLEPRLRLQALAEDETVYRGSAWLGGVRIKPHPFRSGLSSAVQRAGFDAVALPLSRVTPMIVGSAHQRGLSVLSYTIDSPSNMLKLIGLGLDGIISDYPDRLVGQVRAAGTP